jgi:hypothetical protein
VDELEFGDGPALVKNTMPSAAGYASDRSVTGTSMALSDGFGTGELRAGPSKQPTLEYLLLLLLLLLLFLLLRLLLLLFLFLPLLLLRLLPFEVRVRVRNGIRITNG